MSCYAPLRKQEVSFGQLYAPSVAESLASDLIATCESTPSCVLGGRPWGGGRSFLQNYTAGSFASGSLPSPDPDPLNASVHARRTAQATAASAAQSAWAANWTWSFTNTSAPPAPGGFTRAAWSADRAGVCRDSLLRRLAGAGAGASIRNISLCNPPPTAALAQLCSTLITARSAVARRSCQLFGSCVGSRTLFYLPYQWVPTNNEYAGQTVTRFYQSLLTQYPTSSLPAGCGTPPSALGDLATISRVVAQRCPATIMESVKTIVGYVRKLGRDLLEMGYDYYMVIASALAMPAALLPPAHPEMLVTLTAMVMSYFEAFLTIFLKDVFPLLESLTNMVLCSSTIGRIIEVLPLPPWVGHGHATDARDAQVVLQALCEFYNKVISQVIQGVWCYVLMPAIVDILQFVQGLASLGGQGPASAVAAISRAIGGGNTPAQCAAGFNMQTTCNFGCDKQENTSSTAFQPQAMATICWSGDTGGGLLSGQSSLLTCTASDTCALEALGADNANSLVYCGSCPSLESAGVLGAFACDTVLQRCVCGAVPAPPQACVSTSDCMQTGAVCGISNTIGGVSTAFVTPQCSVCASLGQEPVCVTNSVDKVCSPSFAASPFAAP